MRRIAALSVLITMAAGSSRAEAQAAQQEALGGPVRVDSLAVLGNVRQGDATVLEIAGLSAGNTYTIFDIQSATKRLWASGQFLDVKVSALGTVGQSVTLVIDVEEADLLRNIVIEGLEHASASDVREAADLRPGVPLSPAKLHVARRFIRDELARDGIPFAKIDDRLEPVSNRPKEVVLFLDVTEGTRITVAGVTFKGNQVFTDDELRSSMQVNPEGFWWWKQGSYDRERFEQDLRVNLPERYGSRGYLDFQVLRDSLIIDEQTGKTLIEIEVIEGDQYFINDFTISGNAHFDTEDLEGYFRSQSGGLFSRLGLGGGNSEDGGKIFDRTSFMSAVGKITTAYNNEGYLFSRVVPQVVPVPRTEGEPPKVDLFVEIEEGPQAYIARVDIKGNEYTHERVIREKIFLLPGDVYSLDRVIQSYQNIGSLGYFEMPLPEPNIDVEGGDVNITFTVKEQPTGSVNFGTSVGGGTGLSGFIGYDQPNLFGQAKNGSFRWDFGRFANNLTLTYTDPALFQSRVSGSLSLFNARDRFITFSSGRRKRIGGNLRFGFPLPNSRFTRLFVGYGLSRTAFTLRDGANDTSLFGRRAGVQSTLSLGVTRQTLNHPLFPTAGSRQSLNLDLNGGPLGGDGNFTKWTAEGVWWVPVGVLGGGGQAGQGMQLATGISLKTGGVVGNTDRFPFERFWMGGVQFGEQLRGYGETSVTPFGFFPKNSRTIADINRLGNAFLSMTAEFRINVGAQLAVSTFFEAGNVYRSPREIDPTKLFRGAGLGVQLVTPFGPVGLDYAYGFDKPVPGWQLHFRLGPGF
ncbi:MAG: outer membrane protein assembly factor BamA [Gemmatimonadota bacterium]|nr:MAG: outer membrane protein assembly factor BamA [Gemmatimonadota bacterium]